MNRVILNIRIELLSDTIFSSGNSVPGGEDISLRIDSQGQYFLPGSTVKGLLGENLRNYLSWTGAGTAADLHELLGSAGLRAVESPRRLIFGNLYPEPGTERTGLRTFTALKNGVIKHGSLHTAACLRRGIVLTGMILCAPQDRGLVENSLRLLQWIGLKRSRGFGHVRVTVESSEQLSAAPALSEGSWIRYRLRLHTPMAITSGTADPADADRRNYSDGLDYLPGSAVRGMVMSWLARQEPQWFRENKDKLLRQVVFRNALPLADGRQTIPTPMGFYEDREQTEFYSVLTREVEAGHKRAGLGHYFYLGENGNLVHRTPAMEQSLRITVAQNASDRQMFTVEAMAAGTVLEGYIHLPEPSMAPVLARAFRRWVWLGADRYAGSGLCSVELLDNAAPEYAGFAYGPGDEIPDVLYLLVMSPTAMIEHGEVCSLTDGKLSALLGVEAHIDRCAAGIGRYSGFNRTWGCASPLISMYAPGTIFRVKCSRAPTLEQLRALEREGIGVRRAEGCGQLLFLRDFGRIRDYERNNLISRDAAEESVHRQARCRWILGNQFPAGHSTSWKGRLQSLCESILAGEQDISLLDRFFAHNSQERGEDFKENTLPVQQAFTTILNTPLEQTLDCPGCPDSLMLRLQLLCDWMNMDRKEDKR